MKKIHIALGCLFAFSIAVAWTMLRSDDHGSDVGRTLDGVATVARDCSLLEFESSGYIFRAQSDLPKEWQGKDIPGEVDILSKSDDDLTGVFKAADGREISVSGGVKGEHWFTPACAIWPQDGE